MTKHDNGVSALEDRLLGAQEVLKPKNITWTTIVTGNDAQRGAEIVAKALAKTLTYASFSVQANPIRKQLAVRSKRISQKKVIGRQASICRRKRLSLSRRGISASPSISNLTCKGFIQWSPLRSSYATALHRPTSTPEQAS